MIKEGLYEDESNREKILEISSFAATRSEGMVTLAEYVDGFAAGRMSFIICLRKAASWRCAVHIWNPFRQRALTCCC